MFNRATRLMNSPQGGSGDWQLDHRPGLRLFVLLAITAGILTTIAVRLADLQLRLAPAFLAEIDRPTEKLETIPSRHGRILAADGRVLAEDLEQFGLSVHYRWLESPPDAGWLRQQARRRLTRAERRLPERVAAAEELVRGQQQSLWVRLAELMNVPAADFETRRADVQKRVERIKNHLLQRREAQDAQRPVLSWQSLTAEQGWNDLRQQVWETLTVPPSRGDPLIIQEELAYHPLADNLSLETAVQVESHTDEFPGVRVTLSTRRVYPEQQLAAHVLGVRTAVTEETVRERKQKFPQGDPLDYQAGDGRGRSGLELAYESQLRGLRGEQRLLVNRRGEILETVVTRQPRVGRDLVLTLHAALQVRAEEILREVLQQTTASDNPDAPTQPPPQGGTAFVMDVRNGELLVAACAPSFNPNLLVEMDTAVWKELNADPRRPFFNRLTSMSLPPGSVFKPLTAIALVQQGVDPHEPCFCQGYLDHPDSHRCFIYRHFGTGHHETDLSRALSESCNVYFFTHARRLGPEGIWLWARRFGFGSPTGVDLPGERGGHLPTPPQLRASAGSSRRPWFTGDTLGLAIGQSSLTVTPLQIVRMMAAVANGGRLVTPHLVQRVETSDPEQESIGQEQSAQPIPDLAPAALAAVRAGLEQVVANSHGTGHQSVFLEEVAIAGKTGTAEVGGGHPDHAWFAGYVPADRPRYAFVVVLEHAGSGSKAAGPVARELVQGLLEQGLIRERTSPQLTQTPR